MIENEHVELWNRCLNVIRDNVPETTFDTWFKPIVALKYEDKALTIGIPSPFFFEILEAKFTGLLRTALNKEIGEGTQLMYSVVTDKTNHISVIQEGNKRSPAIPPQTPNYQGYYQQNNTPTYYSYTPNPNNYYTNNQQYYQQQGYTNLGNQKPPKKHI